MYTINYYYLTLTMYYICGGRFDVMRCALLYWIKCWVVHCSSISRTFRGAEGWNVGKYFFFRVSISLGLGWGCIEISCNVTSLWAQYWVIHCFIRSRHLSMSSRVGKWRNFFLPRCYSHASDGCGLDELLCALLCEFNVELSIVIPFPTPSKALGVGTLRSIFSSAFQFSLPRIVVDWISCYCALTVWIQY